MEIGSNFSVNPQKNTSFGATYPLKDVLCIMSSSYVIGKQSDTFEHTVSGILNKKIGSTIDERSRDYLHAMDYLYEKYPQLGKVAQNFRTMLDDITRNHFAITDDDVRLVTTHAENQFGSKLVEIV